MKNNLKHSIKKGLLFLKKDQNANGSFSAVTDTHKNFKKPILSKTIFPSCLILSSLTKTADKQIISSLAGYILSQKSSYFTFNYWERNSRNAQKTPYPDDLDDTFCALAALQQYNNRLINGSVLAKVVTVLSSVEEKEGGPYRTWIVPKNAAKSWKDIDLAVNSNVAFFLSLQEVMLPEITLLIEKNIKSKQFFSPYYASPFSVIYFISRFYNGKLKPDICQFILEKRNTKGIWNNPLDTALALNALCNLGYQDDSLGKSFEYLQSAQQQDGSWNAYPFVVEEIKKNKKYFSGSKALTTAICLEALHAYCNLAQKELRPVKQLIIDPTAKKIARQVHQSVVERSSHLDKQFQKTTLARMSSILKDPVIALLPYQFKLALGKNGTRISDAECVELGIANCYGWCAYDIYDDFLDQNGQPYQLPVANIYLRQLSNIFYSFLPQNKDYIQLITRLLDEIEETNFWETTHCRITTKNNQLKIPANFPDYQNFHKLSGKSIGHAISPLALLFMLGYQSSSKEIKNLLVFFRDYLIARQLDDDAHDWEEDLKNGQLTPVVIEILKSFKVKHRKTFVDFKKDLKKLQSIFWFEVVEKISKQMLNSVKKATKALHDISVLESPLHLEKFLQPLKKSAQNTLLQQKDVAAFLRTY